MMFSRIIEIKCRTNIPFFRQTVKRLVTPHKRRFPGIRSVLLLLFLFTRPAAASFEDLPAGARYAALANAGVALPRGADCIFVNPAALFNPAKHFDAHLFYTKPFGLSELHLGTCALRLNHERFAGAVGLQYFGNSLYIENQFAGAAAYRVLPTISIGVTCRYGSLAIHNYGETHSLLFDLGAVARFSAKVYWGFSIKNATNARIGVQQEPLPTVLTGGFCLNARSNLSLLFDLSKDTRFPLDLRCGIDYRIYDPLAIRIGAGTEPTRYCAGFSVGFVHFRIDYAFSSHFDLGMTHLFSIGIF